MKSSKVIPDFLDDTTKKYPQKEALIYEGKRFTYRQIKRSSDAVYQYIFHNTTKGDIIAVLLPNSPEFIFSYFGILKAGCVVLLIPVNISDANMEFQIKKTNPKFIITIPLYQDKLNRIHLFNKKSIVNIFDILKSTNSLIKNKKRKVKASDICSIIFTSGTTSEPKGVILQHKNVVNATKNIVDFLQWKSNDIDVNISPLSHSFGLGHIHCVFNAGGTVILFRDSINLKKIMQAIISEKASTFGAVPAILRLLISKPFIDEFKKCGEYLRFIQTNTSSLEKELIYTLLNIFPKTDFNYYYGLTEASRSTFVNFSKHPEKIGSVGKASPNVQIRIEDKDGNILRNNEIGEVCIKGKHVIKNYWKNEKASRNIVNGWFHTGDMGYLDKDNFLIFMGRKDDLINVSGEKVAPEEIENIVRKCPGILDAAVVGIPNRLLGEAVKLFIVTNDKIYDKDVLHKELTKSLESYKMPREIEIISNIPRTENGKIKRKMLRRNSYTNV